MHKHRISTTISLKHYELLKKFESEYGTQQKVIEKALEALGSDWSQISKYDQMRLKIFKNPDAVVTQRTTLKHLVDGNLKAIVSSGMMELAAVWLFGKSPDEMSLDETVEVFKDIMIASNIFETVDAKKNSDGSYTLKMTHHCGKKYSEHFAAVNEKFFMDYGAEVKSKISVCYIIHTISKRKIE